MVTAKSKDLDDNILRVLKSDAYIDTERRTLYDEFDATFLGVFPDFVNQLNGLLREEDRIGQDLPEGKLSNELRIFALIRLGVTESAQIARFLKKSPSTVYNYRVKLRNAAACDRDEFEKRLMEIGNPDGVGLELTLALEERVGGKPVLGNGVQQVVAAGESESGQEHQYGNDYLFHSGIH